MIRLTVNGTVWTIDTPPDTPLLWVVRETLGLTGTKFGCGMALCGACTVHVEGQPTRSCVTPVGSVADKAIVTIEGLAGTGSVVSAGGLHVVQQAWIAEEVPQCGYCQSGQLMAAAALLAANPSPTDADIDAALSGHICRCGTYQRIRAAVHRAAALARGVAR
jgi:isoquinoline 1-oxidoreductase alpha subunit